MPCLQIGFLYFQGGFMAEILVSPMMGKAVNLDDVEDEMFSKRMLGDGIAIMPEAKEIYSPVDGEIVMVYETQHAIGIRMASGLEILLHIGIDTVVLNGIPFNTKIKVGDQVKKGDLLTIVDFNYIKDKGCDTIVPILAIDKKVKLLVPEGHVLTGQALFEIEA